MVTGSERYTLMELMVCVAARLLEDNKTAVIGTGAPLAAAMLAQKTNAPKMIVLFEAGGMVPVLEKMPISVAGSHTQTRAIKHGSMFDIMEESQRGMIDYTFLAGRRSGVRNINSTMTAGIKPTRSAPAGSGGAKRFRLPVLEDGQSYAHEQAQICEKGDFITSPGYSTGGAREASGCGATEVRTR